MDACTQKAMAVLQDPAKRLPGLSYVFTPDRRAAIMEAVSTYWSDDSATPDDLVASMLDAFNSTS
jgi:glucose/mannose transport system substrate-binding protein